MLNLPDLPGLLGARLDDILADCRRHTGPVTRINRATGGNVSHVFRIHGQRSTVVLKIRTTRFSGIPALSTDPALIADEHRALQIYGHAQPDLFPKVLAFHREANAMILTDVFPDGLNYQQHLDRRPATDEEMARLGGALRAVHQATRDVQVPIRSQNDVWFRDHTFDFCLRPTGHPALEQACAELAAQPGQQLIIGDVAPKNLSLAADAVAFCDLDNVHRSTPLYDVAYFLAHLLLHHLRWTEPLPDLVDALLDAYHTGQTGPVPSDETLLAAVAAGVVLYRLATTVVPYPLPGPAQLAGRFRRCVEELLDAGAFTTADMVKAAKEAKA